MNKIQKKNILAQKRHWRVRSKIAGTAEKPRLSVKFTNKHITVQCIDDTKGITMVSLCSTSKELRDDKIVANVAGSIALAKKLGDKMKTAGISTIIFDRGSRRYHGCVKALADTLRESGINF